MWVFVVIDHICEADILCGVFSTREKAQAFIDAAGKFTYEGPEIYECELDQTYL